MHIDLDLIVSPGLHGTASWEGQAQPQRFDGVLEFLALLERAATFGAAGRPTVKDAEGARCPRGGGAS